jgi:enoyl-CoA hydratase/carnithine racemase
MAQDLLEVVEDGVAVLTLNRPDRLNAMSGPMLAAMLEALPRLANDPDVGVIVLTGAGRGFCAGGDVKAMAEGREFSGTFEEKAQSLRSAMEVSRWLHEMPKVTIAMVRGAAAGAGLSLALACDMRVASDTARFATAPASATQVISEAAGTSHNSSAPRRRASSTTRPTSSTPSRPWLSGSSIGLSPTRGSRRKRWPWPGAWPAGRASPIDT